MDESLDGRTAVILERADASDMEIHVEELGEYFETGKTPHSIVLTGDLDHKESEFLFPGE